MLHAVWKTVVVTKKSKNRITILPSNSTSGYRSERIKVRSQKDICTLMFITALFTIAKRCPLRDKGTNTKWYTMEYYSAFRRKFLLKI